MSVLSLYLLELRRLAQRKPIWLITVLCLCTPLLGYTVYQPAMEDILSDQYIANPVLAAAFMGAVIWAAAAIMEGNRLYGNGTDVLIDAVSSPFRLSVVRMAAMMTLSAAAAFFCALLYMPFTANKMEYLFDAGFYLGNFGIMVVPTWWTALLLADSFYQITRRVELSAFLFAVCCAYSVSRSLSNDYFMSWLNPVVGAYSDGFTSWWPLRIAAYTRVMWLCFVAALWLVSLLCIRKYGKNLAASLAKGLKKFHILILSAAGIAAGVCLYINQPFVDHGASEWLADDNMIESPVTDASSASFAIFADPVTGCLSGRAEYTLVKPYCGEDRMLLNPGYKVKSMTYGGKPVKYRTEMDDLNGDRSTYFTLPDLPGEKLVIEYGGLPALPKFLAVANMIDNTIDTNYIVLGASSLLPIINFDCPQGACKIDITIPDHLVPFLDYQGMTAFTDNHDGTKTWTSECGIYVMNFTAGNYMTQTFEAAGIQVDFVYGRAYHEAVETYHAKEAVQEVLNYCTEHYGGLLFADMEKLVMQQVSVMSMGGQARPGSLEWFESVLSPITLSDPARGSSATEVFIHEMVHQWWGGYGLNCDVDELWSDEGLAVYSTYRIVKEKYGELYADQYYVQEWRKSVEEQNRNFYNRHPEYLDKLPEAFQARIRSENSGVNMYKRMPLMILKAEELVGGEEKMDEILQKMYADKENYYETLFTYQDFLDYCGLDEEDLEIE